MPDRTTSNRVPARCEYASCQNEATVLWRNGENVYCQKHADQFKAASERLDRWLRTVKR